MANSSQIIRHLRRCYEADNRETLITNLFHDKVRHLTFVRESEDLLRGLLNDIPLEPVIAEAASKEANLHRKEKTLVYCAFPIVGQVPQPSPLPVNLCAPLFFYPAEIAETDRGWMLRANLEQQRVNLPVLSALAGGGEISDSFVEQLLADLPEPPFEKDDVQRLMALLSDFASGIDFWGLAEYPAIANERAVRGAMKQERPKSAPPLACLSAAAMALLPNSPDTRGVLYELSEMADNARLSTPLQVLLGRENATGSTVTRGSSKSCVPAVLSQAQQDVMHSVYTNPLTLVIGPPGTGKSYTIAALALDQLSRGQSVLIASRMYHAINVIRDKIETMLGPSHCVIRAGREESVRELKKYLELLLQGIAPGGGQETQQSANARRKLTSTARSVHKLERRLEKLSDLEQRWGLVKTHSSGDWWGRIRLGYLNWRKSSRDPLWESTENYERLLDQRMTLTTQLLRSLVAERLDLMIAKHRADLTKLLHAIRSRTDRKKEKMFGEIDLKVLFQTFPIWLVTLSEVSEVLPLQDELFDVAIIDEATQCDMASCLPVLQRARRVAIVGDPNQLRHVSFLSKARQRSAAEEFGLDETQQQAFQYRDKSILDLVNESIGSQEQVMFLDEHFRSLPQIIEFSNREFYAGALRIMTRRPETATFKALSLHRVNGARNAQGVNREEAQELIRDVAHRVAMEEPLPRSTASSIGILSPFRDQVDHLVSLVESRFSLDVLKEHDFLVGTAHTFQGEERDIMYLSLVVDPTSHPATYRFLNNPNVFNVAITRARNFQHVYCSVDASSLDSDTLLRRYLSYADATPTAGAQPSMQSRDAFLTEVCGALIQRGIHTFASYPVAGMNIDIMAEHEGGSIGIDLIGYPGAYATAFSLERYRMFQRAGLPLFPLPYSAWLEGRDACVAAIMHRLEEKRQSGRSTNSARPRNEDGFPLSRE